MDSIQDDIALLSESAGYDNNCVVTFTDVMAVVNRLHSVISDGSRGLMSDHIKFACDDFFVHVALLFTGIIVHGFVLDDLRLRLSTVVPIPKGKNTNPTDSGNCRGIALGSLLDKVFDLLLLDRYIDLLVTSQLQFGFKAHRSTNMCTAILNETVSYYISTKVLCTVQC